MVYRPFDNVPPEILSHILTLAWLSNLKANSWGRFHFPSIPSLVNHNFNRTTAATPILWSSIRVNGLSDLPHIKDRILRKSGALPLDMYLIFDRIAYKDAPVLIERTILLSPSRCRTIVLSYLSCSILEIPPGGAFWHHIQPLPALDPPRRASRLSIFNENAYMTRLGPPPPLDASLRSFTLSLSNSHFVWTPILFGKFEVLSVVDSKAVDAMQMYDCLDGPIRHSLRSLSFSGIVVEYEEALDTHIFERLEYFELENFYFDEAVVLLSIIQAPNLQHLSLNRIVRKPLPPDLVALWDALRFPGLYKLTLREFKVGPEKLVHFFANLQNSVKSLEVSGDEIRHLHMHPSTNALYSQLLEIHAYDVPLHALAALVEGRCPSLRTLEAMFRRVFDIDPDLMQESVSAQFAHLESLVPEFKVLMEGEDPEGDEPTRLDLEQVLALLREGL